ncbi:MAG: hypothetical protein GY804_10880 [Alphaproteobacteria bacterium]|nr:hypothetical protein [Alphaproteobacteria bacterium]
MNTALSLPMQSEGLTIKDISNGISAITDKLTDLGFKKKAAKSIEKDKITKQEERLRRERKSLVEQKKEVQSSNSGPSAPATVERAQPIKKNTFATGFDDGIVRVKKTPPVNNMITTNDTNKKIGKRHIIKDGKVITIDTAAADDTSKSTPKSKEIAPSATATVGHAKVVEEKTFAKGLDGTVTKLQRGQPVDNRIPTTGTNKKIGKRHIINEDGISELIPESAQKDSPTDKTPERNNGDDATAPVKRNTTTFTITNNEAIPTKTGITPPPEEYSTKIIPKKPHLKATHARNQSMDVKKPSLFQWFKNTWSQSFSAASGLSAIPADDLAFARQREKETDNDGNPVVNPEIDARGIDDIQNLSSLMDPKIDARDDNEVAADHSAVAPQTDTKKVVKIQDLSLLITPEIDASKTTDPVIVSGINNKPFTVGQHKETNDNDDKTSFTYLEVEGAVDAGNRSGYTFLSEEEMANRPAINLLAPIMQTETDADDMTLARGTLREYDPNSSTNKHVIGDDEDPELAELMKQIEAEAETNENIPHDHADAIVIDNRPTTSSMIIDDDLNNLLAEDLEEQIPTTKTPWYKNFVAKNAANFGMGFVLGKAMSIAGTTYAAAFIAGTTALSGAKETLGVYKQFQKEKAADTTQESKRFYHYESGKKFALTAAKNIAITAGLFAAYKTGHQELAMTYAAGMLVYKSYLETKLSQGVESLKEWNAKTWKSFGKGLVKNLTLTGSGFAGAAFGSGMFFASEAGASDTTSIPKTFEPPTSDATIATMADTSSPPVVTETPTAVATETTDIGQTTQPERSATVAADTPPAVKPEPIRTASLAPTETGSSAVVTEASAHAPEPTAAPEQKPTTTAVHAHVAETASTSDITTVQASAEPPAQSATETNTLSTGEVNPAGKYANMSTDQIVEARQAFNKFAIEQCVDTNGNLNKPLFYKFVESGKFTGVIDGLVSGDIPDLAKTITQNFRIGSNTLTGELPTDIRASLDTAFDSLIEGKAKTIDLGGASMHHFDHYKNEVVTTYNPPDTYQFAETSNNPSHTSGIETIKTTANNMIASVTQKAQSATDIIMSHVLQLQKTNMRAA